MQAFQRLEGDVGQVRHDISVLGDDFRSHVKDDKIDIGALKAQVDQWIGQAKIVAWLAGGIFGTLMAHVVKHWGG